MKIPKSRDVSLVFLPLNVNLLSLFVWFNRNSSKSRIEQTQSHNHLIDQGLGALLIASGFILGIDVVPNLGPRIRLPHPNLSSIEGLGVGMSMSGALL